jgi:glycosyltransferase involved in cell wall biosynthesis
MTKAIRILFVTPALPWPHFLGGGGQRTSNVINALQRFADVDLVHLDEVPRPPGYSVPKDVPRQISRFARPYDQSRWKLPTPLPLVLEFSRRWMPDQKLAGWLCEQTMSGTYSLVVFRYSSTAAAFDAARSCRVPFIIDVDDVNWRVTEARYSASHPILSAAGSSMLRRVMLRIWRRAGALWFCNEGDRRHAPRMHSVALPNIPFEPQKRPPCPPNLQSRQILFVGLFHFEPNVDGIERFLHAAWPAVKAAVPSATLRLVGAIPPELAHRWNQYSSVTAAGYVDDVRAEHDASAFTIAPIHVGGGTKTKVIESLFWNRTCVVSPHAYEGLSDMFRDTESVLLGQTDDSFASQCIRLLSDAGLRTALAHAGCKIAREQLNADRFNEIVEMTCHRVLSGQFAP